MASSLKERKIIFCEEMRESVEAAFFVAIISNTRDARKTWNQLSSCIRSQLYIKTLLAVELTRDIEDKEIDSVCTTADEFTLNTLDAVSFKIKSKSQCRRTERLMTVADYKIS